MDLLYIDGHNDTMMRVLDSATGLPQVDIGGRTNFHIDLDKLRAGRLSAPIFAAFSEGYYENSSQNIEKSLSQSLAILNALYFTEEKNSQAFKIVSSTRELEENFRAGKISALASIEGAYFIDKENYQEILGQIKDLKIKILGFNWNYANYLGVGAAQVYSDGETKAFGGLTKLGEKVLAQMEGLGLGIDVSHMDEETFWGVVGASKGPIIASHSGAYSLREHRRNLKDDQLLAIKKSGGLVGVVLCSSFLKEELASLDDYMDHLNYMVDLIGVDHVAIGSDLDGTTLPMGIQDASDMYKIEARLREIYQPEEVEKILSGNFLRVFRELEAREDKQPRGDLSIETNYKMGELKQAGELLGAKLSQEGLNIKVILDGIVQEEILGQQGDLSFSFRPKNQEQFHILTLEASLGDSLVRNTKILRIK